MEDTRRGLRTTAANVLANVLGISGSGVALTPMISQTADMAKNKRERTPKAVLILQDLEQIQSLLGYVRVQKTEPCLGSKQRLSAR